MSKGFGLFEEWGKTERNSKWCGGKDKEENKFTDKFR